MPPIVSFRTAHHICGMAAPKPHVGVAGWSLPSGLAGCFGAGESHLARYATRFDSVEINSSFYRPHRHATYVRWAASVPGDFRFCVKMPKAITHENRLRACDDALGRFAEEISGLGAKRGPVLVQLPPGLGFEAGPVDSFLAAARRLLGDDLVLEPRHRSWFEQPVDRFLAARMVARVAADPAVVPAAAVPGGYAGTCYFRLHGSPRIYWSDYPPAAIARHRALVHALAAEGRRCWTIFDNTASGHAVSNALSLVDSF